LAANELAVPNESTCTEWSITRSTGCSGLIFAGSPPSFLIASRITARSATTGTPVKSCSSTRAGMNETSRAPPLPFHLASASICPVVTIRPSSRRSTFSIITLIEYGIRASEKPRFSSASSL
jgi:hypothetical protein